MFSDLPKTAIVMRVAILFFLSLAPFASGIADTDTADPDILAEDDIVTDERADSLGDLPVADNAAAVLFSGRQFLDPQPLDFLGEEIPAGSYRQLAWSATELFEGLPVDTPVLVLHGRNPGPILCLTAAIHGDEINGIEIVRRVLHGLQPSTLTGTVIGVPIVNIQGFRRGTRYLPDRRDLNRHFPGTTTGSAASRIANSFFNNVVRHCDALVDIHTGSFERSNLPQLRADLADAGVRALANGFGATVIVNSQPRPGTLRYAATLSGVPTVTLEAGGPERLEQEEVTQGVRGIETLLRTLGMVVSERSTTEREETYYRSAWVRADRGGILIASVGLGSRVSEGDLLGKITDPINNETVGIYAPRDGRIIGMARNQVVMPGFAAFHLGLDRITPDAAAALVAEPGDNNSSEE
ncbi:MAG: succinylglutamate desuccinylase/aspartoacylase family protein [Pseudomonadota bacterium]